MFASDVLFTSIDTVSEPVFPTRISLLPLPLTSSIVAVSGSGPVGKSTFDTKFGDVAPPFVVLIRTDTVLAALFAVTMSGRSSAFRSPAATENGDGPTPRSTFAAKLGVV